MARTFRGRNVVKVQTLTWYLRGLVSLGYLSLIWVQGNAGVTILLIVYTLFSLMRLVGVVMYDYTFKSITTNKTRGRVIGNANVAFQSSTVFARLLNFIVTSIQLFSGVMGLIALQMFGVINNTIAARYLSKIPCRTKVDYRKGRTLFTVLREAMRDSMTRSRLLVFWYYMSVTVIMGMSIAFLTKVVGLESNIIFLYTIVISGSVILAGSFCTFFSDRLGSRPLIIANGFALMVTLIGWMVIPASAEISLFFVLGFLSNFFLANVNILIRRLLAAVIPDNDPVGFNSMTNFMIAFFALFSGLAGGYLANLSDHIQLLSHGWGNAYTFTFGLALLFSLLALISTASLHEQGALSAKAAAQLMFSLHGLRAFINIDRLEKEKTLSSVKAFFSRWERTSLVSLQARLGRLWQIRSAMTGQRLSGDCSIDPGVHLWTISSVMPSQPIPTHRMSLYMLWEPTAIIRRPSRLSDTCSITAAVCHARMPLSRLPG